jgi:hypothetical protein
LIVREDVLVDDAEDARGELRRWRVRGLDEHADAVCGAIHVSAVRSSADARNHSSIGSQRSDVRARCVVNGNVSKK